MPPPLAPPMRCLRRRWPAWPWALPGRPAQAQSQPSRLVCRSLQPWPPRPTSWSPSRRSPSWMRCGMRRGMRRCMRVAPEAPGRRGKQWVCRGAVGRRGGGGLWRVCVMNARNQTEPYGTLADERTCPANPSTPIPLHSRRRTGSWQFASHARPNEVLSEVGSMRADNPFPGHRGKPVSPHKFCKSCAHRGFALGRNLLVDAGQSRSS